MTFEERQGYKDHPDYAVGFDHRMDGQPAISEPSVAYRAGWEAAGAAVELLSSHGFKRKGRSFTKRMMITGNPA